MEMEKTTCMDDKISHLPNEILVTILSLMTMKEATRTSVLSRRWEKLWCLSPSLDFDASDVLSYLRRKNGEIYAKEMDDLVVEEGRKYVDWVNHVLKSCNGGSNTLDQFRVRFDFGKRYKSHIDSWVHFALRKKVKCLIMDFSTCDDLWFGGTYLFPSSSQLYYLCNTDCSFLKKLYLRSVNIDGNLLEHLISSFPRLEELTITLSSSSREVVHIGPSVCLKLLKIYLCCALNLKQGIRLSATNLSTFKFEGATLNDIFYDNVPNLVKLSIGGCNFLKQFPRLPSHTATRLETLKLHVVWLCLCQDLKFPKLPNLKNLILVVGLASHHSLLDYASLIEAAPSLCKVKIRMNIRVRDSDNEEERQVKKTLKCPLRQLKEIEVVSFTGHHIEREFVEYLLENASVLKKVIIDCLPIQHVAVDRLDAIRSSAMTYMKHISSQYSLADKLVLRNF